MAIAARYSVRIISERHQGIWHASAAGYNAATNDIIARCDADSQLPPDWVEQIKGLLALQSPYVAVTGPGKFYDTHQFISRLLDMFYMKANF